MTTQRTCAVWFQAGSSAMDMVVQGQEQNMQETVQNRAYGGCKHAYKVAGDTQALP